MSSSHSHERIVQRRLRKFYEHIICLGTIGPIRGDRTRSNPFPDALQNEKTKAARGFSEGLAYIASYEKDADHVTAIFCSKLGNEKVKVSIAANSGVENIVIAFIQSILQKVQHSANLEDPRGSEKGKYEKIVSSAIDAVIVFNEPRLAVYRSQALKQIEKCLPLLENKLAGEIPKGSQSGRLQEFVDWLKHSFSEDSVMDVSWSRFARKCWKKEKKGLFAPLKGLYNERPERHEIEKLLKLLYKIGKHVTMTIKIFEALSFFSSAFAKGFEVEAVDSPGQQTIPIVCKQATARCAMKNVLNVQEQRIFLSRLHVSSSDPSKVEKALDISWKKDTFIHAELLLMHHIYKQRLVSLDPRDRYIGVSKPACYLCHATIECHPGGFVVPKSHQKAYIKWRLPGIAMSSGKCEDFVETIHILERLISKVQQQLRKELSRDPYPQSSRADSTGAATSTESGDLISRWLERLVESSSSDDDVFENSHDVGLRQ